MVGGKHLERRPYVSPDAEAPPAKQVWGSLRKKERAEAARPSDWSIPAVTPFGGMPPEKRRVLGSSLSRSLDQNLRTLRGIFHWPRNAGLVIRRFSIPRGRGTVSAAIAYIAGIADEGSVREHLLKPLMDAGKSGQKPGLTVESLGEKHVSQLKIQVLTVFAQVTAAIVEGEAVLFLDGDTSALSCGTRAPEHRAIEESPTEAVVRGPHTGFIEDLTTNLALLRTALASPDLIAECLHLGARGHWPVSIVYLEGVANPKLVDEVRRRISSISVDAVTTTLSIIGRAQDSPANPFPKFIATERPDKTASMIAEGHVAILGNCSTAVLVPATVWGLLQSSEDHYVHFIPASLIRLLRWLAVATTVYASSLYVAIVTFHPAMLPSELLFAIAAAREAIPLPAGLEVLAMELAFELIREAGIRIPAVVGPTIGIVGAVVLGQAAVQARIVSPVPVVVVAISGLGSFSIPDYNLNLYVRLMKFVMVGAAAFLGIPGITLVSLVFLASVFSLRSFGVPVTAPLLPGWPHSPDFAFTGPPSKMESRPGHTRPLDARRQKSKSGSAAASPATASRRSEGGDR